MIKLGEKIKTSGNHKVDIDLHPEISCSLNIEILSPKSSL
jgi:ribosomal protein L9